LAVTNGHLVSPRFPYIRARVQVRHWHTDVEALLDTGFDGDVVIPPGSVPDIGPPDGHSRWILADGSPVLTPYYVGMVWLAGLGPFSATVTVLGDEPLVGAGAARHVTIVLDHGRRVIVQP
jgi:predicted aspartyl protease